MKSAILYQPTEGTSFDALIAQCSTINQALPHWEEPAASAENHTARIDIGGEPCQSLGNSGTWLRFRRSWKTVPASAVKHELQKRIDADPRDTIPAAQRREWKEQIEAEMLLRMPHQHGETDLIITPDHIIVGGSAKQAEWITDTMRQQLGSLAISPYPGGGIGLHHCIRPMVRSDDLGLDNIELAGDIKVEFGEGEKVTFTGTSFADPALQIMRNATAITSARISRRDTFATVSADWALTRIKTEVDPLNGEEYDDWASARAAELFYYSKELPALVRDLAIHGAQN